MALGEDLNSEVRKILQEPWAVTPAGRAPTPERLGLGNEGRTIEAAVLYADLDESTKLVDSQEATFAGQLYKSYLVTTARVIGSEQGTIAAFDGDRIMAVYTGRKIAERAVRTALKIHYAVQNVINPAIGDLKPGSRYLLKQSVGVDCGQLLVVRTGIHSANDLVWIGRAANYAAKLSTRPAPLTHITDEVYQLLPRELKVGSSGQQIWTYEWVPAMANRRIYSSSWWCKV